MYICIYTYIYIYIYTYIYTYICIPFPRRMSRGASPRPPHAPNGLKKNETGNKR